MQPGELSKAIASGKIPNLLCLYGEENYFISRALEDIERAIISPDMREFNYQQVYGKGFEGARLRDDARTLPVFAAQRMIVIRRIDEASAAELERLQPYLKEAVPETILVATAEKIDGRRKFYQDFKKHGQMVEFKKLYENKLPGFVQQRAKECGFELTDDAMSRFCRRVGTNLQEVAAELEKLAAFLGDKNLADVSDIDAVISNTRIESIFGLTDAVGARDAGKAIGMLHRILEDGTAPLAALAMLVRHFRQLWKASELLTQGVSRKEMPRAIGVNPYFLDGLLAQARRFERHEYRMAFDNFVETDLALKSSGSKPAILLERLLLAIVNGNRT
jgi:DNA polymerase-3 subunit delta